MGEPTEISDAELDEIEKVAQAAGDRWALRLIAALRSARERRDAAHTLLVYCATHLQSGTRLEEDIAAWRATMQHTLPTADDVCGILAHPTTEEPTE